MNIQEILTFGSKCYFCGESTSFVDKFGNNILIDNQKFFSSKNRWFRTFLRIDIEKLSYNTSKEVGLYKIIPLYKHCINNSCTKYKVSFLLLKLSKFHLSHKMSTCETFHIENYEFISTSDVYNIMCNYLFIGEKRIDCQIDNPHQFSPEKLKNRIRTLINFS